MLKCTSYFLIIGGITLAAGAPTKTETSVECRTEYITVWETEYEEREVLQECVTEWVPDCKTASSPGVRLRIVTASGEDIR